MGAETGGLRDLMEEIPTPGALTRYSANRGMQRSVGQSEEAPLTVGASMPSLRLTACWNCNECENTRNEATTTRSFTVSNRPGLVGGASKNPGRFSQSGSPSRCGEIAALRRDPLPTALALTQTSLLDHQAAWSANAT